MKQIRMKSALTILGILFFLSTNAQEKTIKGIVTTFDSIPLMGATIKVKSTKEVVHTDPMGKFTIKCKNKDKLKITAQGFYNQVAKIEEKTKFAAINLELKPGVKNKELALGITDVTYHDKLNALASLDPNDIDFSQYKTLEEAIYARIPGVSIVNGQIIIRGNNSISGPTPALIVVDGVKSNSSVLRTMNPATIKSINVIKDGSSAIYGSQGANGVVIIETKSGKDMVEQ